MQGTCRRVSKQERGKQMTTTQERFERWLSGVDEGDRTELEAMSASEREDAFFQDLAFGTAGLRGVLGLGSNRMNVYTVAQATQGLADYLNAQAGGAAGAGEGKGAAGAAGRKETAGEGDTADAGAPLVAVCRDSRRGGEEFVRTIAGVLAANGVRCALYPRVEPTPALSFAVRHLHADAGINVTASHNPAAYNGYKVYGADGCQIKTEQARAIQQAIDALDAFADVKSVPFKEAVETGLATWMGEEVLEAFVDAVAAQSLEPLAGEGQGAGADGDADDSGAGAQAPLHIVYTPLNGSGLECCRAIFERVGGVELSVVPSQEAPDGDFPTCPYPNPEIREALGEGLKLCAQVSPDILIATDPDCDRVGTAVLHDGKWRLPTGNEMGALLLDYICTRRAARGEDLSRAVAVTTIVSTTLADELAAFHGFELRRVLTGFKYIGEQIALLEAAGQAERFVFGFEESYGYLSGAHVRDKDAVNASMLIAQMTRFYKEQGMDLLGRMDALYAQFGYRLTRTLSYEFSGAAGAVRMKELMGAFRTQVPAAFAGLAVQETLDYESGCAMPVAGGTGAGEGGGQPQTLPAANVLEYRLDGGAKVLLRPSGTEPKVKAYLFANGDTRADGEALLDALEADVAAYMS